MADGLQELRVWLRLAGERVDDVVVVVVGAFEFLACVRGRYELAEVVVDGRRRPRAAAKNAAHAAAAAET